MKTTYLGSSQTVIIKSADNVDVTIHEYPLAKVVEVTARRWATLKRLKAALVSYVPSDEQFRRMSDRLMRWGRVCYYPTAVLEMHAALEAAEVMLRMVRKSIPDLNTNDSGKFRTITLVGTHEEVIAALAKADGKSAL